jgi:hypothetical protein
VGYSATVASVSARSDLERFCSGDPDAMRAVYRAYGRLVYKMAYKLLGNKELAEEATQQAFVQAWKAAATFDPSRGELYVLYFPPITAEARAPRTGHGGTCPWLRCLLGLLHRVWHL